MLIPKEFDFALSLSNFSSLQVNFNNPIGFLCMAVWAECPEIPQILRPAARFLYDVIHIYDPGLLTVFSDVFVPESTDLASIIFQRRNSSLLNLVFFPYLS